MAHVFGADNVGFGTLTGWSIQAGSADTAKDRPNTLGPTGNESASNLIDSKDEVTTTYKANTTGAPSIPPTLGATLNGVSLLGISLSTVPDDFATMVLTGHVHNDGTHGTLRTVAHGVTLTSGFGADAAGWTPAEANGIAGSTINITCQHIDNRGGAGNTIVGENYDAKIEKTCTALGGFSGQPSGYDITSSNVDRANTDHKRTTETGIKALVLA